MAITGQDVGLTRGIPDPIDTTIHQLVYWDGYQAALKKASTDELTGPGAWQWYDDLMRC